ncbi:MAG: NAD(P)/FAD-dependent oxidoreductase [Flavobacteriales bacterium]
MSKRTVIIGNGISGITAARHIRKRSDRQIIVISGETDHFFARTALMYIYMGHLNYEDTKPYEDFFWDKNRIELIREWVEGVDTENKKVLLTDEKQVGYDELILATGSTYNKFGWPGQDLKGVQGLYSYQDLQLMEENTKNIEQAVIVGGGLIGVEMAEMLSTRNIPVTFLVREDRYWGNVLPYEEGEVICRHIHEHHIDLRLQTEMKEIIDDGNGRVKGIRTKDGQEIECQFVGLTVGVHPKIKIVKDSNIETDKGILVNNYLETNIPDVYAIGDCAQFKEPPPGRAPIQQVWYTGRMQGETVAKTICDEKTEYKPGVWFNSAKFFDIEYQTYGVVKPQLEENEDSFYWEHENGKKCIRVVFDKNTGVVKAFNLLGIRFRHEVCEMWIKEGKHIDEVMQHLPRANFDPEFYKQHEPEIIEKYNLENNKSLQLKAKKGLFQKLGIK